MENSLAAHDDRYGVLHVVVGHGLPVMYRNTLDSIREVLPNADVLVIDNDSPQNDLKAWLRQRSADDAHLRVVMRTANELANGKVGGLYQAYRIAFEIAAEEGIPYVHLMQADMQLLWWDNDALAKAIELFERHPQCVNIFTLALSSDRTLTGDLKEDSASSDYTLVKYGLTDTGLFSVERWERFALEFGPTEEAHAAAAKSRGLEVVVSPWPTEVQVPWPAVIRFGRQRGREIVTREPFLCRPLAAAFVAEIKTQRVPASMETLCTPWGWSCLAPMWNTDLKNIDYLALRWRAIKVHGVAAGAPRWAVGGLKHRYELLTRPHRPSLVALVSLPSKLLLKVLLARTRRFFGERKQA